MRQIVVTKSAIDDVLNERCVYVDKTAYLYRLITSEDSQFFFSCAQDGLVNPSCSRR